MTKCKIHVLVLYTLAARLSTMSCKATHTYSQIYVITSFFVPGTGFVPPLWILSTSDPVLGFRLFIYIAAAGTVNCILRYEFLSC